jgi:hypothetical protein
MALFYTIEMNHVTLEDRSLTISTATAINAKDALHELTYSSTHKVIIFNNVVVSSVPFNILLNLITVAVNPIIKTTPFMIPCAVSGVMVTSSTALILGDSVLTDTQICGVVSCLDS